jgi:hypothetical protein
MEVAGVFFLAMVIPYEQRLRFRLRVVLKTAIPAYDGLQGSHVAENSCC